MRRVSTCLIAVAVSLPSVLHSQGLSSTPTPTLTAPMATPAPERIGKKTPIATTAEGLPGDTLDEILVVLKTISEKIQPVAKENLFTKIKDDYLSNLVWEFLGYHRGKGGYLPFIVTIIAFITALLKLWLTFTSKNKDRPAYLGLDATVSIAFFGLAAATLWLIFGGPVITPATTVDLAPLQQQVLRLQATADDIAAVQSSVDPKEFSKLLAQASTVCTDLRNANRVAFEGTRADIARIPASIPGYGCMSLLLLTTAIGAAAAIWMLGLQKGWW